jgi:hypothetical protein
LFERQQFLELLKQNLQRAQQKMKADADVKRSARDFQLGELALLKLQPYARSSLVNRPYPKLSMKFFGPYKILDRIGNAAYKLELYANSKVHPAFHVSQLKSYNSDHAPEYSILQLSPQLDMMDLEPKEVLDRRLSKKGNTAIPQVLVKWTGVLAEMAT